MPFQVSLYTTKTSGVVTISLATDVTSPCIISLNLIATVTSGNPADHTYLWEQVSGAQVVFNTPTNQLSVNCTLLDSTDKVFYFWVDKNTTKETRYVFNYHGTATETTSIYSSNSATTSGLVKVDPVSSATIIGTQAIFSSSPEGTYRINPNSIVLKWQLPSNTSGFVQSIVEQIVAGVWTSVLTVGLADEQHLINAQQNTYYRIKTTYLLDGQYYSQYSGVYYLQVDVANYNAYIDDVLLPFSNNIAPLSVGNYTLLNTDSVTNEIVDWISASGSNSMGPLSTSLYTLLNLDGVASEAILDTINASGSNTVGPMTVVYFGGTAIGG